MRDLTNQKGTYVSNSVNQKNFDSALTVILTEANLDGTRWMITKIQEAALREPDADVVDILNRIVAQVESQLDRRTVELTGKYGRD